MKVISNKMGNLIVVSFILIVSLIFLYNSINTGFLGEDESAYIIVGEEFSQGIYEPYLVTGHAAAFSIILPLLYSPFFMIFGSSLAVGKFIVAIFGVLTMIMVYLTLKKHGFIAQLAALSVLLLIPMFTHLSLLSYTDIPIAFFSALSFYLFLNLNSKIKAVILGIILAISYHTKTSGLFLVGVYFLYALMEFIRGKNKENMKLYVYSLATFSAFIVPFLLRNIFIYNDILLMGRAAPFWLTEISRQISVSVSMVDAFTFPVLALLIFGSIFAYFQKDEKSKIALFTIVLFIVAYLAQTIFKLRVVEPRYFTIIYPQIAILVGLFLSNLTKKYKYTIVLVLIILSFAFLNSFNVATSTAESQRWPQDYLSALTWIEQNTPQDAVIFTTYSGTVRLLSHRESFWIVDDLPEIITSGDSDYAYNSLKSYGTTYVLIWRNTVANAFVIPSSNLLGVYTVEFVNLVINDERFEEVYSTENVLIYELI